MSQFQTQLRGRAVDAVTDLHEAQRTGDHHMVEVRLGELDSLARLAREHGVDVEELRPYGAAGGMPFDLGSAVA